MQVAPNRVDVDEFNRWAAPLNDAIAQAVAGDLVKLLGTPDVVAAPMANFDPAYRVTIDVQRFESIRGQAAMIEAVWTVHKTAGGETRSGRTVARETVQGDGFDALAAAHSRAIAKDERRYRRRDPRGGRPRGRNDAAPRQPGKRQRHETIAGSHPASLHAAQTQRAARGHRHGFRDAAVDRRQHAGSHSIQHRLNGGADSRPLHHPGRRVGGRTAEAAGRAEEAEHHRLGAGAWRRWRNACPMFFSSNHELGVLGSISWLLFLAFITWNELRAVLRQREVTSETISMSISVYLLLGLTWGLTL